MARTSPRPANRKPRASRGIASAAPGVRGFDAAADLVAAELERSGRSLAELAAASGVGREMLSYWINGRRPLRADYLLAVIAELGLTLRMPRPDRPAR